MINETGPSQLRLLAKDYADGRLQREDYLQRRTQFLDALGNQGPRRATPAAPRRAEAAAAPAAVDSRMAPPGRGTGRSQGRKTLVIGLGIGFALVLGAGAGVWLLGGGEPAWEVGPRGAEDPSDEPRSESPAATLPAPQAHAGAEIADGGEVNAEQAADSIEIFLDEANWGAAGILARGELVEQWQGFAPELRAQVRAKPAFRRLERELHETLEIERALGRGDDELASLLQFGRALGITVAAPEPPPAEVVLAAETEPRCAPGADCEPAGAPPRALTPPQAIAATDSGIDSVSEPHEPLPRTPPLLDEEPSPTPATAPEAEGPGHSTTAPALDAIAARTPATTLTEAPAPTATPTRQAEPVASTDGPATPAAVVTAPAQTPADVPTRDPAQGDVGEDRPPEAVAAATDSEPTRPERGAAAAADDRSAEAAAARPVTPAIPAGLLPPSATLVTGPGQGRPAETPIAAATTIPAQPAADAPTALPALASLLPRDPGRDLCARLAARPPFSDRTTYPCFDRILTSNAKGPRLTVIPGGVPFALTTQAYDLKDLQRTWCRQRRVNCEDGSPLGVSRSDAQFEKPKKVQIPTDATKLAADLARTLSAGTGYSYSIASQTELADAARYGIGTGPGLHLLRQLTLPRRPAEAKALQAWWQRHHRPSN